METIEEIILDYVKKTALRSLEYKDMFKAEGHTNMENQWNGYYHAMVDVMYYINNIIKQKKKNKQ